MRALLVLGECGPGQPPEPPPRRGRGSRRRGGGGGVSRLPSSPRLGRAGAGGRGSTAGLGRAAVSGAEPPAVRDPPASREPGAMGPARPAGLGRGAGAACGPICSPRPAAPPPCAAPLGCGSRRGASPGSLSPACAGSPAPKGERHADIHRDANTPDICRLGDGEQAPPEQRAAGWAPGDPLAPTCAPPAPWAGLTPGRMRGAVRGLSSEFWSDQNPEEKQGAR